MTARPVTRGPARDRRRPEAARRRGFTLLEMMAVILIIAILIAIALPAFNRVIYQTRIAGVKTELAGIGNAVATFKTQYNTEPPSFIDFTLVSGQLKPETKALLRKMFPQIDFSSPALATSMTQAGLLGNQLRGSEALVFFLGGVRRDSDNNAATPLTIADKDLVGFSKNPSNPFAQPAAGQTNRITPMFDFDTGRLVDTDNDGLLEYMDKFPGQKLPLIYGSTAGTGAYRNTDADYVPAGYVPVGWSFYKKVGPTGTAAQKLAAPFWNPNSYQLISPGADGLYGDGLEYDPNANPKVISSSSPVSAEADNLTNFADGQLGG